MKRIFLAVFLVALTMFLPSCKDPVEHPQGFVYLEDDVFKIDGERFFPLMLNYKIDIREIGDDIVISPSSYYENQCKRYTKEEINDQFAGHVELIKDLGFNTIRICLDVVKEIDDRFIDGIADVLDIAAAHDIKVMLLMKPPFDKEWMDFTAKIMSRFADDPTIFAYDMMNEPLYFDPIPDRDKRDAVKVVSKWRDLVRKNAPNHLFTIGFAEPIEVFEWDASMLPVDFVQIHTYHPLRIENEIWWYSHYVGKPWMIGETSLPSDNDSVSYDLQKHFVEQVYQYTIDCGGIGFGWWEFQDVLSEFVNFEANYAGLLNQNGITYTKSGKEIKGSLKPAAYEFKNLNELKPKTPVRPINYFNMLGYENYVAKGRVMCDEKPVEGALVRGWNQHWRVGMNTYTDENGDFTLYSNDKNVYFEVSAPGLSTLKFYKEIDYQGVNGEECDCSDLKDVDLEYQKISFLPFLQNDTMLFEFKSGLFDKSQFTAEMGTVELKKL